MRVSLRAALAAALCSTLLPWALVSPAKAGSYTEQQILEFFLKDKAAAAAAKAAGKTRAICIGTAAECPAAPEQNVGRFDLLVNFDFNSADLTKPAKDNLDLFAQALKDPQLKGTKFEIDGHTDASGGEDYNLGLSERRANSVVAYLTLQGIDATTLIAKGFGKTKPRVADPFSPENRRVETHLLE